MGDDKTAMAVSAHAVRPVPGTNADPEFPDSDDGYERDVNENSAPGTPVGKPVKASDTPGETLTYGLREDDAGNYTIDATTGQLRVGARGLMTRTPWMERNQQPTSQSGLWMRQR